MASQVGKLIMETILGLITTAFAFVAGLAWNDAIQKLIEHFIGTGDALPSLLRSSTVLASEAFIIFISLTNISEVTSASSQAL